jgi:cytochrome c-type biogenesis protein CcmH
VKLKGWAGWGLLVVALVALLAVGAARASGPRTQSERIDSIARTIRCPTCAGESVYESKAAAAENVRSEIARQVAAGRTDGEIRQFLADRYGNDVLLVPSASGVGALVWVLPVAITVLALGGLVVAFRRWSRNGEQESEPTDDDRALVEAALSADDQGVGEGSGR